MVKFNYERSQNTASKLIAKFGGKGFVLKLVPGSGGAGNRGKPTYTPHPVDLVVIDYTINERASSFQVGDQTSIEETDKHIFVSMRGLTVTIEETDRIQTPSGKSYEIIPPVRILDPSEETIVFYEIQGRL